ncbi:hypothetical protein CW684_02625 [Macrococcoides caseolyticum]|uniref:hypothetical protein n=1 Tax=Macrococcoides caseolyticum TaxID=69966 RepID=UPI000C34A5B1|nr:hypothetical protein [Macrococcus caseolyticus]PKE45070.1 hypothetical protein CW666_00615 [Macrococcus caseolyticus]PKF21989.1 hypothetical protein CW684_02625 [Macrococcus caseolyticus]PKF36378.1 hypothetical protein CW687_02625 [Macrococcus caseolyticus]
MGINKKKIINLLGLFTLFLLLVLMKYELLFIGILILLYSFIIYLIINTKDIKYIIFSVFNLLIYLIILYYHQEIHSLPTSGNDDIRFERLALNYYEAWINGYTPNVFQNSTFYSKMIAGFYYLFGYNPYIPGLLNILIHMMSILMLIKICKIFLTNKVYILILLTLYAYNPFHIAYTIITMREILIIFLILCFIYCLIKYHITRNNSYMLFSVNASVLASLFHIGLLTTLFFIAIYILLFSKIKIPTKVILSTILFLVFASLLIVSDDTKLQMLNKESENIEVNRTDYIILKPSNIIEYPIYIIKKSYYLLAKPFVIDIKGIADLIAYSEKLLYVVPLILALIFYKRLRENKPIIILIFFCLFLSIVFGIGTENYGTGIRHREKFVFLLYIIPFYILSEKKESYEKT